MTTLQSIGKFLKDHVFSRFKAKVALFVVTALCLASLLYQYFMREDAISIVTIAGAVVVPFQEGVNEIGGFLFKKESDRIELAEAKKEIEELERENAELYRKIDDLRSLGVENEELRSLLFAKERLQDYEMEEAQIIGNDGVNCFERFTINKGSVDGIKVNMNVINNDGLIGIVTHVGLNYAIVTSIIEDGMNVSAMTKNGHENCIVSGDLSLSGAHEMRLDNALASVKLEEDSTLVTSYISDKFLPNLLIGYAEEVTVNSGDLTKSATVKTAVDFTDLNEVLVITTMREDLKETEE